jgi:hypothetical protein
MRRTPGPGPQGLLVVALVLLVLLGLAAWLLAREAGASGPGVPGVTVVKATDDEVWVLTEGSVTLEVGLGRLFQPPICVPATDDPAGPERCFWIVVGPCRAVVAGGVVVDARWVPGRCTSLPLIREG